MKSICIIAIASITLSLIGCGHGPVTVVTASRPTSSAQSYQSATEDTAQINQVIPPLSPSIINTSINIAGSSYFTVPFWVDNTLLAANVIGSFSVLNGGAIAGIFVYIFDSSDYDNWVNGRTSVNTLYNSGNVVTSYVSAAITTAGEYYMVFDNNSGSSSAQVAVTMNLETYQ